MIVRNAVATCESVFLIPHLAKIDVIPAKKEDPTAYNNHMITSLPFPDIYGYQNPKPDTFIYTP